MQFYIKCEGHTQSGIGFDHIAAALSQKFLHGNEALDQICELKTGPGYAAGTTVHLILEYGVLRSGPGWILIDTEGSSKKESIPDFVKGKTNLRIEKEIRDRLCSELGGIPEADTPGGQFGLLTESEIIEIKAVKDWKKAMGQVIAYATFYSEHSKRIHLFGKHSTNKHLLQARSACATLDIVVTYEEVQ